jgi:hypothetical protein
MGPGDLMGDVRIGTSGWSYPSGPGTWNGIFYPSRRSQPAGWLAKADELAYYAEHFDTVEVNSSFYRLPDPAVTKKLHDALKKAVDDPSYKELLMTMYEIHAYRDTKSYGEVAVQDYKKVADAMKDLDLAK